MGRIICVGVGRAWSSKIIATFWFGETMSSIEDKPIGLSIALVIAAIVLTTHTWEIEVVETYYAEEPYSYAEQDAGYDA